MNVFITGATGFLGTNLVKRLVEEFHHVYILVRSQMKAESLLNQLKGDQKKFVHIIEGNLSQENLGIPKELIKELHGNIDVIYHTAAYLSFDESKRGDLFEINITGTQYVLEFSEQIEVKKFIHVSTAYTLGRRDIGKEELYPIDKTPFINSYEESKCRAEHLVMSYQNVFDVTIMRPAIIIGDSNSGEANTTFGLYGILRTVELLKKRATRTNDLAIYRLLMEKNTLSNLVPVDYVANVLILALKEGKKDTVYHITNPNPPSNEVIFEAIKEVFQFDLIALAPIEVASQLTEKELKLNQPLEVFKEYLNRSIVFEDNNTRELLENANEQYLHMDKQTILRIIEGYYNRDSIVV